MDFLQTNISGLAFSNELSLFLGIAISALFYMQYRKYEKEIEREEMIDQFLKN